MSKHEPREKREQQRHFVPHLISQNFLKEVDIDVKARTKGETRAAKTLCTPFDQPKLPEGSTSLHIVNFEIVHQH
ncbi:hypothetical protein AAC387_Pa08g1095 [Persea americana]